MKRVSTPCCLQTLGSVLNLQMIEDKTSEEIAEVSKIFKHKFELLISFDLINILNS